MLITVEMAVFTTTVYILGAGNFGTSLAHHLGRMGHEVVLWSREERVVESINNLHVNPKYLHDLELPPSVTASRELEGMQKAGILLLALPSHALREALQAAKTYATKDKTVVSAIKGMENNTFMFPRQVVGDVWGDALERSTLVLSGPSFASEIAAGHPSCVAMAGQDTERLLIAQKVFHSPKFRTYTSRDPWGLEFAGAFKNIVAIAAGACGGLGFGENSKASLITRGLAEMVRIGCRLGADPMTFYGLGGAGDLFLTCSSIKSRNYQVGYYLGQGLNLKYAMAKLNSTAEGVRTSKALYALAKQHEIDSPIVDEVYLVLHQGKPIADAFQDLINRDAKPELD